MLDVIKKFELNNTIYFECLFTSIDSAPADPTGQTWKILDTKSGIKSSGTPFKKSTGQYYFFWTPTETGNFLLEFSGTISGQSVKIRKKFKIYEISWKAESLSSSSSSCSSSFSSSSSCSSYAPVVYTGIRTYAGLVNIVT